MVWVVVWLMLCIRLVLCVVFRVMWWGKSVVLCMLLWLWMVLVF